MSYSVPITCETLDQNVAERSYAYRRPGSTATISLAGADFDNDSYVLFESILEVQRPCIKPYLDKHWRMPESTPRISFQSYKLLMGEFGATEGLESLYFGEENHVENNV